MNGAHLLRQHHDELVAQLAAEIADGIPEFNRGIEDTSHPLRRQRQKALRRSLVGMADAIDARHGVAVEPMDWGAHVELGRMERRHSRPLGELLRAPWIASRTIIRLVNERANDLGLSVDASHETSEVVVEWSDQISIAFSEGYNDETAARSSQLEARRQHLLRTVLGENTPTAESLEAAALAAEWRPPPYVRVLIARGAERDHYRRRLPGGSIVADVDDELIALIPWVQSTKLPGPAEKIVAALGPPAATPEAAYSARLARRAIAFADEGNQLGLIDCAACELDLVALADQPAASHFSHRLLGSIENKPQLIATLDAWLSHHGRPKATANALGLHPNTVTYRINLIREQLGPILDDPAQRLALHLATHIATTNNEASSR